MTGLKVSSTRGVLQWLAIVMIAVFSAACAEEDMQPAVGGDLLGQLWPTQTQSSAEIGQPLGDITVEYRQRLEDFPPGNTEPSKLVDPVTVPAQIVVVDRILIDADTGARAVGAGTLTGTLVRTPTNNEVTFDDLVYNTTIPDPYELEWVFYSIVADGFESATQNKTTGERLSFIVDRFGDPQTLVFGTAPQTAEQVDTDWTAFTVEVQDGLGQLITTDDSTQVTIDATGGTGVLSLGGTPCPCTVTVNNGVATFSTVSYSEIEMITLEVTSPEPTVTNSLMQMVDVSAPPGVPVALRFVTGEEPQVTQIAGDIWTANSSAMDIQVEVIDIGGTRVTTDNSTEVKFELVSGTGTLMGTLTGTVSSGLIHFTDLVYEVAEDITVRAIDTAGTLTPTVDVMITVNPGDPAELAYSMAPRTSELNTIDWNTFTLEVFDAFGNFRDTDSTTTATLSLVSGGGTLDRNGTGCPCQVTASNGVLTFDLISYAAAAMATLPENITIGITSATVGVITLPANHNVTISAQPVAIQFGISPPSVVTTGEVWDPFSVEVVDSTGDPVGGLVTPVLVEIITGTGTLTGTTQKDTSGGTVTFADLVYDTIEPLEIRVSTPNLPTLTPITMMITAFGPPSQLVFGTAPGAVEEIGRTWASFTVQVQDAAGNVLTTDNSTQLTLELSSGNGILSRNATACPCNVTVTAGEFTFSTVSYDTAESIVFDINAGVMGVTGISQAITITSGQPDRVAYARQPAGRTLETAVIGFFTVQVQDAVGNLVPQDGIGVNIFIQEGIGGGDLTSEDFINATSTICSDLSPCTVFTESGISVFDNLTYDSSDLIDLVVSTDAGLTVPASRDLLALPLPDLNQPTVQITRDMASFTYSGAPIWAPGNASSRLPTVSRGAKYTAFESLATLGGITDTQFRDIYFIDADGEIAETNFIGDGEFMDCSIAECGTNPADQGLSVRITLVTNGADNASFFPDLSDDGRFLAFASDATNLVAGDANASRDIFVYDDFFETIERVSLSNDGSEANGDSDRPAISASGRFVAFASDATNLVLNDRNNKRDIFIRDRARDLTTRVSLDAADAELTTDSDDPDISADGRFVVFQAPATAFIGGAVGNKSIFRVDRDSDADGVFDEAGTRVIDLISANTGASEADGDSFNPVISYDGDFVAFDSLATDLVVTDTNGVSDVFRRDVTGAATTLVSVNSAGTDSGNGASRRPSITADGQKVAFESDASDLVAAAGIHLSTGVIAGIVPEAPTDSYNIANTTLPVWQPGLFVLSNCQAICTDDGAGNLICDPPLSCPEDMGVGTCIGPGGANTSGGSVTPDNGLGNGEVDAWFPALQVPEGLPVEANLVEPANMDVGDANGARDIFVRDVGGGTTTMSSLDRNNAWRFTGRDSLFAAISPDGTYVAFESFGDLGDGCTVVNPGNGQIYINSVP